MKLKISYLIIFLLFSLGLFFRLYHIDSRLIFDWDQQRDAQVVKELLVNHKITLIGPRVVNDSGFFLGPYFFYLLAPFYLITSLHPISLVIFLSFYFFIFFFSALFILKKLFSLNLALIFLTFWTILPLPVSIDTIAWNPLLVPLFVIFSLYLAGKAFFSGTLSKIFLGLFFGLAINFHVQLLFLFPFILFAIKTKSIKSFLYIFLGFILSFLPLFLFDLRHGFLNFHLIFNFLNSPGAPKDFFSFIPVWRNFINFIFPANVLLSLFFWLIILILLFFLKHRYLKVPLILTWLLIFPVFSIYGHRPSEYYFNFSLPLILLVISYYFNKIPSLPKFLLLSSFTFYSIFVFIKAPHVNAGSIKYKIETVQYIKQQLPSKSYNLSYSVPLGGEAGFSYLLDYYDVHPSGNSSDPLFRIISPPDYSLPTFGKYSVFKPYF